MDLASVTAILEVAYYGSVVLGIPVAVTLFFRDEKRRRSDAELDAYLRTQDLWLSFLQTCLDRNALGFTDFRGDEPELRESGLSTEQMTMFEMLFAVLERNYVVYRFSGATSSSPFWSVWREYMEWWASRDDFQRAWKVLDPYTLPELKVIIEESIRRKQHANGCKEGERST